jgi:hypothetical protein
MISSVIFLFRLPGGNECEEAGWLPGLCRRFGEEINPMHLPAIGLRFLCYAACSLVTVQTELLFALMEVTTNTCFGMYTVETANQNATSYCDGMMA